MRIIGFVFLMIVFALATAQPSKAAMDCVAETPLPMSPKPLRVTSAPG